MAVPMSCIMPIFLYCTQLCTYRQVFYHLYGPHLMRPLCLQHKMMVGMMIFVPCCHKHHPTPCCKCKATIAWNVGASQNGAVHPHERVKCTGPQIF